MITNMNMHATIQRQDNKCLKCGEELPTGPDDQVFFVMDQKKDIYEVYCMKCKEDTKKSGESEHEHDFFETGCGCKFCQDCPATEECTGHSKEDSKKFMEKDK